MAADIVDRMQQKLPGDIADHIILHLVYKPYLDIIIHKRHMKLLCKELRTFAWK
jgi:hypothetical protein